ncbi:hypothetical protein BT96DRAFT_813430 [Gymnopus androsaceus JB14]|uniref:Manganese/iron superoxide dismutase C-terminal domain-containing protein n=1 Tax=Gymnopus androsaceus JB14 TaxID=1447944 RepID=A0A6A4HYN2_9AGAR|nr:hypothetical protein BT96DRAFT_813430 [Gymnopus androsaceus JB14]
MNRLGGTLSRLKWRTASARRGLHTPRRLPYDVNKGLGDFLPPEALKVVGHDYQKGLLDRLNDEVKGTEMEGMSVVQTIVSSSPDRTRVLAFNYASLALNNHFFLDQLKPPPVEAPDHQHLIGQHLELEIRAQHGSIAQLKSAFSAAAMGLFTNGWVWFVTDVNGNTAIVPTLGPGSLLMRSQSYIAHAKNLELGFDLGQWNRGDPLLEDDPYYGEWKEELEQRQEQAEANALPHSTPTSRPSPPGTTPSSPASGQSAQSSASQIPPHTRSFHSTLTAAFDEDDKVATYSRLPASITEDPQRSTRPRSTTRGDVLTMGETLYPLFCISANEHAWMSAGYGVWGKEEWLKKFWSVLDWEKVSKAYDHYRVKAPINS